MYQALFFGGYVNYDLKAPLKESFTDFNLFQLVDNFEIKLSHVKREHGQRLFGSDT